MADYNTLQRRRNLLVGGFVIVGFCVLVYMLFLFRDLPGFVSRFNSFQVFVDFPAAPGIQDNTRVHYCGYQIGRVTKVFPPMRVENYQEGGHYHRVRVRINIDRKFNNIPSNIDVFLMKRGLGSSYIDFVTDPKEKIEAFLEDGDLLTGSEGTSTEFIPKAVQDKIEKLVDSVSMLANHANDIVGDDENKRNIKKSLRNIEVMTRDADETFKSIKKFSDKGSAELDRLSEQLYESLVRLRSILNKVDSGQGTVGKFVNDGRIYENLHDSTVELEIVLEQIKMLVADMREKGVKINF